MSPELLRRIHAFIASLLDRLGPEALSRSALTTQCRDGGIHREDVQRMFSVVESWRPKHMVEIGTHLGVTASALAMVAEKVSTFNLHHCRQWVAPCIFRIAGVSNVEERWIWTDAEKGKMLDEMTFDAALIDGYHTYDGVKFDFAHVRKCGRVIFHDYEPTVLLFPGVKQFIDELAASGDGSVRTDGMFAYWESVERHAQ